MPLSGSTSPWSPRALSWFAATRAAGYGVHLATNQDERRRTYMRETLGYDALFDVSCYSCELGVAKPDTRSLSRARDGSEPLLTTSSLIDDIDANVVSARAAGLAAIRWTVDDGQCVLLTHLARHGVVVGS